MNKSSVLASGTFLVGSLAILVFTAFGFTHEAVASSHSDVLFKYFILRSYLENEKSPSQTLKEGEPIVPTLKSRSQLAGFSLFDIPGFVAPPDSLIPSDSTVSADSLVAKDSLRIDSLITDTVKIDPRTIDSTARIVNLRYDRFDLPHSSLYTGKPSSLYVQPDAREIRIEIDSIGNQVIVKEFQSGIETKIWLRMSFDDYLQMRTDANRRKLWDDLVYSYELQSDKKELGQFFKDITDFQIPLPKVGVLSIFGEPKISLRIGGSVDIHAGWKNETQEGVTASRLGNTRNEPDFKQQVQINVNGTIGDKLQISADWNTERTFEFENQLKIKYTGYEDEIVKSVEAGNVSLQTSGLVGGSDALFGVKAEFQMGPFNLTAIASQKKGEVKEKTLSGGASTQQFTIRAPDFSRNHFFVDTIYADTDPNLNLFNKYYGNNPPQYVPNYLIKRLEVWKSVNTFQPNPKERNANAYINLDPRFRNSPEYPANLRSNNVTEVDGEVALGRFLLLEEGVDYEYNEWAGFITFKSQVNENEMIAVAYQIDGSTSAEDDDLFYGDFITGQAAADTSSRLVLKLVKPINLQPQFTTAWKLQLKNIYPVGGRNIKQEGFDFNIYYEVSGQDPQSVLGDVNLLQAFQLDKTGEAASPTPDGKFDFQPGITILPETGEIIFPFLEPFGANLPANIPDAADKRYDAIYTSTNTVAKQDIEKNKWMLKGEYSGSSNSRFQLGFNVIENSVKVFLDGRELSPGSDYSVDYNIGELVIRNSAALVPGANLRVSYEENDLFSLASKTLFGARGMLNISDKTKLGFSALTLSQQTLSDKVRIGEEPISNSIFGLDFSTSAELPFLTKLIDNIISTREISDFTLRGEAAYMLPDPNTKKSTVASDQGKSIAYIDDFEGAKKTIPIGVSYGMWKDLSVPDSLPARRFVPLSEQNAQGLMKFKSKSWWYNILPSITQVNEIWPNKQVAQSDQAVTVLDYVFSPGLNGTYNYAPNLSDKARNWGGMMKILSSSASNLVNENIEFIEFWVNIVVAQPDAKIFIDLGKISEDVIPNGDIDKEDQNFNELIDNGEDTGLDGMFDAAERDSFNVSTPDPSGDNFQYTQSNRVDRLSYLNINGTENNAQLTDIGLIPDTEDLNRNNILDRVNSYFRYEIPLDTNTATNPYVVGGGSKGWYQFRIPLRDATTKIGRPELSNVEFIRLFTTGVTDSLLHIRLVDFNLVGNQWRNATADSTLRISIVNVEDNPDYQSPPGVQREKDRTRPDLNLVKNEQALNMVVEEIIPGQTHEAIKNLFRPLDVFNYGEMKLFVRGNPSPASDDIAFVAPDGTPNAQVGFRFGTDTNNFYEYRMPLDGPGNFKDYGWSEIAIKFSDLTALKQVRDSATQVYQVPVEGRPGHFFVVRGNPSLTQVKFLSMRITNVSGQRLKGEMWVNEMRVIGADDTPGWAYTATTSLKLADIGNVNFNISRTDPYFHRLNDRFGSRVLSVNWGASADVNVLKLMPINMPGSNLRLSYSRTESLGDPLYLPGTDIKVEEAQQLRREKLIAAGREDEVVRELERIKLESQTLNTSNTWSLSSVKFVIPVEHWIIRETFNAITYGFSYNQTFSRNPNTLASLNWQWNANINYAVNFSQDNFFNFTDIPLIGSIFGWLKDYNGARFYFSPQNFSSSVTARRNRGEVTTREINNNKSTTNISRDFTSSRGFSFSWKITDGGFLNLATSYNVNVSASLAHVLADANNIDRSEGDVWSDILYKQGFGRDYDYSQNIDLRTSPRLPALFDLNKYFTISTGYKATYSWRQDFRNSQNGRSASVTNSFNAGVKIRLKALMAPLFDEEETKTTVSNQQQNSRNRNFDQQQNQTTPNVTDSSMVQDTSAIEPTGPSSLENAWGFVKSGLRILLFDYEIIDVSFSNRVSYAGGGMAGTGTGFSNFWGLSYNENSGPSRLYMLGLSQDLGRRTAGTYSDAFSESNTLDLRTSKPLWEGAKIDLNWKLGWDIQKNSTITIADDGFVNVGTSTTTGKISRSFLSLPPTLIFSFVGSGITKVNELYKEYKGTKQERLSKAFVNGFESLPLLGKLGFLSDFINYIPRPNWAVTWSGLEKYSIFESWAQRVSLDHRYSSDYSEGFRYAKGEGKTVVSQRISYGFNPLIGLNLTFKQLWDGNFTGNVKYSTRSSFDIGQTTTAVTEGSQREIGISLNYNKSGFEIPLFGISLKNDIEFSFSYTLSNNSSIKYEMDDFKEDGTPLSGTNSVTFEPRVKYVISSRLTMSLYYRRTETTPEGANKVPPTTRNEAGLDIRISIQQ